MTMQSNKQTDTQTHPLDKISTPEKRALVINPLIKIDYVFSHEIWTYTKTYANGEVVKGDFGSIVSISEPDIFQIIRGSEIGQPLIKLRVFLSFEDFNNGNAFKTFVLNDLMWERFASVTGIMLFDN